MPSPAAPQALFAVALALLGLQPCVATCPPGTFSPEGGACKPCAPGSYQWASGASSCKLASPGFYVAAKQATAQEPCPAGYYQGESGGTLCTPCRRGTYNAHVGQAVCSVAGAAVPEDPLNATHFFAGYYVDREGATAPTKCPFGTQALKLGQSSCDPWCVRRLLPPAPLWFTLCGCPLVHALWQPSSHTTRTHTNDTIAAPWATLQTRTLRQTWRRPLLARRRGACTRAARCAPQGHLAASPPRQPAGRAPRAPGAASRAQ